MATLHRNNQTVTVPDSVAHEYLRDGWSTSAAAPPTVKPKAKPRSSTPRSSKRKESAHGLPSRADGPSGSTSSDG